MCRKQYQLHRLRLLRLRRRLLCHRHLDRYLLLPSQEPQAAKVPLAEEEKGVRFWVRTPLKEGDLENFRLRRTPKVHRPVGYAAQAEPPSRVRKGGKFQLQAEFGRF